PAYGSAGHCSRLGWEQAAATLGILAAGAAYLPLDPGLPPARLAWLLADAGARWAVTAPRLDRALAWPAGVERLCLDEEEHEPDAAAERQAGALAADEPRADGEAQPLAVAVSAGEPGERREAAATAWGAAAGAGALAYVIYTSGSTGQPKGVMVEHRAAVNTVLDINRRFAVGPRDRVLAFSALGFDLSVYDLFGLLGAGGSLVVPDPASRRDPAQLAALLRRAAVTIWNSVPALMEMLVDYLAGRGEMLPPSLRLVLLSGDWIPVTLPERIWRLAPGARVVSLGGATEAAIWSVIHPVERVDPAWSSIPYGLPLTNQTWHVLDDGFEARPDWVAGELHIGGLGLARGYWRDPERTALAFRPHPVTGERLYRTGDLGRYLPDGELELLGRRDLQVKIQGYRVELGEVEAALGQHPAVRQAVAAVVGDGPGERRLAAYVVGRHDRTLDLAELRRFAAARLPDYMLPVLWTELDALPLSANGKVDRRALPPPGGLGVPAAAALVPALATPAAAPGPSTPVTAPAALSGQATALAAARIAALIAGVLGIASLDPESNLLELGATSVQLVRI
ncbi:MAG TPA: amino acid adenylation domain-containing protein, partial [Thermoanaerobaculia bacterium]